MEKIKKDTSKATKKASIKAEQRRNDSIERLKEVAPTCYTLSDVCEKADVPHATFESWATKTPKLREEIKALLAKNFTVKKQTLSTGEKELTFTYADVKKHGKKYTDNDKNKIVDIVCYAVENGISVDQICKELGLSPILFFRWANADGSQAFLYAVEKYAESKKNRQFHVNEADTFTARQMLQARLERRTLTNTTLHYETRGLEGEKAILKGKTVHEREIEADLPSIALLLNNLDPSFKKVGLSQALIDTDEFIDMTVEQLEALLVVEDARLKILNSNGED